jgi:hypothetical protein
MVCVREGEGVFVCERGRECERKREIEKEREMQCARNRD